jgi:alanyl-tRNA synthetase
MFDTHGFPPELFEQIAKERGLLLDWDEYRAILEGRKKREQVDVFASGPLDQIKEAVKRTEFLGYQATEAVGRVVGIVDENCRCDAVADCSGQRQITVVLDRTPFYGEAGGQVGDQGELTGDSLRFEVQDTQRYGELILHLGRLRQGRLAVGQSVTAKVHAPRRQGIRRAHSATHVLHYALQKHLGRHAQQQGSKVDDDWLRFDFTSLEAAGDHLESIQAEVLEKIRAAAPVSWSIVPLAEARQAGAMMLFGEKYPDPVRMVTMGDFSRELCGGTHLDNTREIGDFEILAEESISAGVRRITAVTGAKAQQHVRQTMAAVEQAAQRLGIVPQQLADRVASLSKEVRELRKQLTSGGKPAAAAPQPAAAPPAAPLDRQTARRILERCARQLNVSALDVPRRVEALLAEAQSLRQQLSASQGAGAINAQSLLHKATDVAGVRVIVSDVPIANPNQLRQLIDQLRKTASPVAVLLAGAADDKVTIVAGMSHELVARGGDAGRWVREVAAIVEGGGGGKPDMAQAGGKSPHKLPQALEKARQLAAEMLT